MQVSIARNNNGTMGCTTKGHCLERFGFIWPFSDPRFGFGAVRGSTNPDFMLNLNGGHSWSMVTIESTPQELGILKRERSERFYFLVIYNDLKEVKVQDKTLIILLYYK